MEAAEHFKAPQTFTHSLVDLKFLRLRSRAIAGHGGSPLLSPPFMLHPLDFNPSLFNVKHFAFLAGCFPRGQADEKTWGKPGRSLTY